MLPFIYTENHISYFYSTNPDPAEPKNCKMTQAFSKLVYRNITRINSNYLQTFSNLLRMTAGKQQLLQLLAISLQQQK